MRIRVFLPVLAAAALLALPSTSLAALHGPKHALTATTSTNWSGYAVDGTNASSVSAVWTQPTATCGSGENSWSSPWVGIDGDNSATVEQTGTDSDCKSGAPSYYAWWEMYPKKTIVISQIAVHPGDVFLGTVTYSAGAFVLKLTDTTTGASYTTTQSSSKAARSSVEWIEEGPSKGLLTDFGSLTFSSATAAINGQSGGLSSLSGATPITMVNGSTVRAQPGAVSSNAFTVTWESH